MVILNERPHTPYGRVWVDRVVESTISEADLGYSPAGQMDAWHNRELLKGVSLTGN